MQDVTNHHIDNLSVLPKDYVIDLALNNNDIINNTIPYNVRRLELFMYRYLHKIPDKIRIVEYVTGGYPRIGILEIFKDIVIYTVRVYNSTDETAEYQSFFGNGLIRKYRKEGKNLIRDYYLVTYNYGEVPIFSEFL